MILGVGVDLVDVSRMERILRSRSHKRFLSRVFSLEEVRACEAGAYPAEGFAARFAAKEAVAKALGTGFSGGITPGDIRVHGGERSRPCIELSHKAREVAGALEAGHIHVSLTHTGSSACAFVVIEKRQAKAEGR